MNPFTRNAFTALTAAGRAIREPTLKVHLPLAEVQYSQLYPVPETHYAPWQRAGNAHIYHIAPPAPVLAPPVTTKPGYLAREAEEFNQACKQLWQSIKAFCRELVRQTIRWVVMPLALISAFGSFAAVPAELPANYYQTEAGQ